jgi:hypothetical protein
MQNTRTGLNFKDGTSGFVKYTYDQSKEIIPASKKLLIDNLTFTDVIINVNLDLILISNP